MAPVEHSDDLDPAFKQSVKYKVLGEPFQWKHLHAGEEGAPARSYLADFGLARQEAESLFGGPVEAQGRFEALMRRQVFRLHRHLWVSLA